MLRKSVKRIVIPGMALALLASAPAYAQVSFDLQVSNAPPVQRYEVVPGPRYGYVWVPGYWDWGRGRYHWVRGYWVEDRPGYNWVSARWERSGRDWRLHRGHWENNPHWDRGNHRGWDHDRDDRRGWDHDDHWHTTHQSWNPDRRWEHD